MFSDQKQPPSAESGATRLGEGTFWKGEIFAGQQPIRIDGTVEGTITSDGKVTIAPTGRVKGTLLAKHLVVTGHVEGVFKIVDCLEIHGTGDVHGDVESGSLVVDEGSTLQGRCTRRGFAPAPGSLKGEEGAKPQPSMPASPGAPATRTSRTGHPLRMVLILLAALALLVAGGLAYRRLRHPAEILSPPPEPGALAPLPPGATPVQAPAPEALKAPHALASQSGSKGTTFPIPAQPKRAQPLNEAGQAQEGAQPKAGVREDPGNTTALPPAAPKQEDKKENPGP